MRKPEDHSKNLPLYFHGASFLDETSLAEKRRIRRLERQAKELFIGDDSCRLARAFHGLVESGR